MAWQDYIQAIIRETVSYQINNGGPVIGTISITFLFVFLNVFARSDSDRFVSFLVTLACVSRLP